MSFVAGLVGLVSWTLAEYLVHRFILHGWFPRYHAIHHRNPLDGMGIPYPAAGIIATAALTVGYLLAGTIGIGFVAGHLVGYGAYVLVHEGMHHHPESFGELTTAHDIHHRQWRYNYGVTSPIWDVFFGTYKA
ncbi:hypothetical protein IZ6_25240 [Terrihabitans soli]|uniref:Fatty acid hydroxylase domain-containing protein n=1 Tax=Terrihabitans soli TaxID=708113 RepID=A0A6S6QRV4_9HYPH|nr:sterol desaturase family protein [Terrihabitans soli]BCJ91789.1 hypothetical protein IZ6_25240 [Terrihabitans soli]